MQRPPTAAFALSPLVVPGWLLLAAITLTTWLGLALPAGAAFALGPALALAVAFALVRLGVLRLRAVAPQRDLVAPVAAAVFAATLVFLYLQTNHVHDCPCHQGYTLAVWRGALPPPALHDATQPSAYHFGFDVLAAALHAAFRAPLVELSLDLASGLAFLALGLAAAGLLARWRVPPWVRALGVLLLVFGIGPLFLAGFGAAAGPVDDWLHRWHGATFLSVVGLAGRRPTVLGVLVVLLFLDLLRGGALRDAKPRGAWGVALLLGLLVGSAALVAEEALLFGAVALVAWVLAAGRPAAYRALLVRLLPVLAVVVPLALLSGGLLPALLRGSDGAPPLGLVAPGLPSFRGRAPITGGGYWLTLLLELGPLPLLLPALLARRTGTPRPYAVAVLAAVGVGFALANVLSFGGYDTDLHRLALPLAHLGFLHAPVLVWTLLSGRRRLAVAALASGAALSLVTSAGFLFRMASPLAFVTNALTPAPLVQDLRPFLALLPLAAAALVAARARGRWRLPLLVAGLGLAVLGGGDRIDAGRTADPWHDARCNGPLEPPERLSRVADEVERLIADGHPAPVLTDGPLADALMARGLPVVARGRPPQHGRVDRALHARWLAEFDRAAAARWRPGILALPPDDAERLAARTAFAADAARDADGYRLLAAPAPTSEGADPPPEPVLVRRLPQPIAAAGARPAVCPTDQGSAIGSTQAATVVGLFAPYEPGGAARDGLRVGDVAVDANGFSADVALPDGASASVRFGGCPQARPVATTASFYVTADPPGAPVSAIVAAVAANDDGTFWAGPGVATLSGFRRLAGDVALPPPSPLPNTLTFLAFALLAVVFVAQTYRTAIGTRGAERG